MNAAGRRRGFRSWFVEPYIQVKLGLVFLTVNFIFSALVLGVFGYYFWDVYQTLTFYFQLTSDQSAEIVSKLQTPIAVGAFLVLAFIISSILLAVRYTHRIYGPLVSIHRFLDSMLGSEEVTPLVLRESDQLQGLADKLNRFAASGPATRRSHDLRPIFAYLDALIAGKQPEPLRLPKQDPYEPLAERLNLIAEKLRRNRAI